MSEKLYGWLLRLYPSRFREAYGEEVLQLFRDRVRDETGFRARVRLWLDLVTDLVLSLPSEYFAVRPAYFGASAQASSNGIPSFLVLADEAPAVGALCSGALLSVVALATFSFLLNLPANHAAFRTLAPRAVPGASRAAHQENGKRDAGEESLEANGVVRAAGVLDAAERRRVIEGAIANLKEHYAYPGVAQKTTDMLRARAERGDYDRLRDGTAFAKVLTWHIRETSGDLHLDVVYSRAPLPEHPQEPGAEDLAAYREELQEANCTFEKVEMLPHQIGYVKLNSFPDVAACEATARAAMEQLNGAHAMIFDLRENRGGQPEMVMLLAAYFFDHPEYMYNPRENTTERSWTQSPVPANKLADKPVFILTSRATASGAEHFSYDLRMLKRATLVGETTSGAAHSGVFHRIDEHFGMGISEAKPINPFSKNDWAVVGVEPDVKVKAADALRTAQEIALKKIHKK
jgi:hypothetical protein